MSTKQYFTPDFLKFYKELASNNHKDWFDQNRERYQKSVKEPFEQFVNDLIQAVQKKDRALQVSAKDSIFRINRDIRFAKDKSPYKIYSAASLVPGGRKEKQVPGFYFQFGPESVEFYGGAYWPGSPELENIRTYISKNLKAFDALVNDKKFKNMYGELMGEETTRVPAKFKAAAEKQPLMYRKQFYFGTEEKPSLVTGKDLMKKVAEHYETALPMIQFLRKAVQG